MTKKVEDINYYAVIFTSKITSMDEGYKEVSKQMEVLARKQPGFLGLETAREEIGITISYWESLEAIKKWKQHAEHLIAQKNGKEKWYSNYHVRICKVEREYSFSK
jgi:heme-degrading monooxygenase HmoA